MILDDQALLHTFYCSISYPSLVAVERAITLATALFIPFFLLNAAILGAYLFATLGGPINFFGYDEYGLN